MYKLLLGECAPSGSALSREDTRQHIWKLQEITAERGRNADFWRLDCSWPNGSATGKAQSQAQEKSADKPALEFDVVSIKPVIPGSGITNLAGRIGISDTPDGFVARVVTAKMLILTAYAVDDYQLSGATGLG